MTSGRQIVKATTATAVAWLLAVANASAHGLAGKTDLPIPSWLFAWAGSIVLAGSFVALSTLWDKSKHQNPSSNEVLRFGGITQILPALAGIASFAFLLYAGFWGQQNPPEQNILPVSVFVIFWIGIPVLSLLFGDFFMAFNPWRAVGRALSKVLSRKSEVADDAAYLTYPDWLGRWPAAVGLLLFAWVELALPGRNDPSLLAWFMLGYAIVQIVGIVLFGDAKWSGRADGFAVYFNFFARMAPFRWGSHSLSVQKPLWGLTRLREIPGTAAVVLVMIATTSFDGFSAGELWRGSASGVGKKLDELFNSFGLGSDFAVTASNTVGILVAVALISGLYALGLRGMSKISGSGDGVSARFAHTLIPIAAAYVIAHYFSLVFFESQLFVSLLSDPLNSGANYFGTADLKVDYQSLSSAAVWYVQVAALVVGHVAGLVLAHDRALAVFRSPRKATQSQVWMLAVMVTYTCLGLWILS